MRNRTTPTQDLYEEIIGALLDPKVDPLGGYFRSLVSLNLDIAYAQGAKDSAKDALASLEAA